MLTARAATFLATGLVVVGLLAEGAGCGSGATSRSSSDPTRPDVPDPPASPCGNGRIDRGEMCDDGNGGSGDGCTGGCVLEEGWACPSPGGACHRTTCGDGVPEGWEQCDDGNARPFDGCSARCRRELDCRGGECAAFCGDAIVSSGEGCDDGNSADGDGCSKACTLELGTDWECRETVTALPDTIAVQAVFRDFRGVNEGLPSCPTGPGPFDSLRAQGCGHPDFETYSGGASVSANLVKDALAPDPARPNVLMPVFDPVTNGKHPPGAPGTETQITSAASFAQWYVDVPGVNRTAVGSLRLSRAAGSNTYVIDQGTGGKGYFPLDAVPTTCAGGASCGWGISPNLPSDNRHDFHFTTETRYQFTFQGGEVLTFAGDDDVWVFIGGKLAVDIGGVHESNTRTITLDDATATRLGLVKGRIYEMALFHAERHTEQSNFTLTLGGFLKNTTVCTRGCGNGKLDPGEQCDLGPENGQGTGCSATCQAVGEW